MAVTFPDEKDVQGIADPETVVEDLGGRLTMPGPSAGDNMLAARVMPSTHSGATCPRMHPSSARSTFTGHRAKVVPSHTWVIYPTNDNVGEWKDVAVAIRAILNKVPRFKHDKRPQVIADVLQLPHVRLRPIGPAVVVAIRPASYWR